MIYPPFPFKHDSSDNELLLDINKEYIISEVFVDRVVEIQGLIKREFPSEWGYTVTYTRGSLTSFKNRIELFKKEYEFLQQFEDKLK